MDSFATFREVACAMSPWAKWDHVGDHDPIWHEFGVLGHCERVFCHAIQVKTCTGIDMVRAALWHDIGKFVEGGRREKEGRPGIFTFKGHEKKGRDFLCFDERRGRYNIESFSERDLFLIENHGIIRGDTTVEGIAEACGGDSNLLQELVLLCSADAAGKGHTQAQDAQRIELAPKFAELARRARSDDWTISLVHEIVASW